MKQDRKQQTGLLVSFTLLLSACSGTSSPAATEGTAQGTTNTSAEQKSQERVLKDALGHEVKVPAQPQRKGVSKDELIKDPVWSGIPAVKEGHVYDFGKDSSWLYTGTIANGQMIDDVLKSVLQ